MKKIRAVIFDMDGVLIDAKEWHYEALNKALALFGYNITREEHLTVYDGLPTKVKLQSLTEQKGLPKALHKLINEMKQQYTAAMILQYCRPRFNHEFALARLKSEGYKIAVCSNSIRSTIELMMEKAALAPYLVFTVSNEDVKKAKPDPEIYNNAITRLGLSPDEVLVVEDNKNGIQAALAAGANLLKVETVDDVNYYAIKNRIKELEEEKA